MRIVKHDVYYQAMLARDYRFDGKFFVGVKTTGIYCRPICPARPKRENVDFYTTAAAAEKAGFRPCLRCRPESAPLSPAWYGKSAVVQRALRVISADGFFESDEDGFADQFGLTARHLRRLFVEEVGLTPKQIAFNNRLNFARKLIVESNLPMTSVAMTAGFSSLRRFNDAFKKRFHRAPSEIRKKKERISSDGIELSLSYRPPLNWETLLGFYRTHLIYGMESVSDSTYERFFRIGKTIGNFQVTHNDQRSCLTLRVSVENPTVLFAVTQRVRQMFDLDSDPLLVANSFQQQKFLNSLWNKYPGLRLARGWDPYEMAICTILGQLVSVTRGRALVAELVQNYGEKIGDKYLFPTPEALAKSDLLSVKTTGVRRNTIRELSRQVARGELNLLAPQDTELLREQLLAIPGIGPWSAEYISLRALGNADAFPGSDLILKRAVDKHSDIDFEKIRPWRGYAAVYLWKHYAGKLTKPKDKTK